MHEPLKNIVIQCPSIYQNIYALVNSLKKNRDHFKKNQQNRQSTKL